MLDGKRIAILAEDAFEDSEIIEPLRSMKNAGARVVIIGTGYKESYRGKRGNATITVDKAATKVKAEDFNAVIIPGGFAPDRMQQDPTMVELVKKAYQLGKVVAAICYGPQMLISADIARGHQVTSCPVIAKDLRNAGADWVDAPVVRDGNIITARKPADLPKFNKAIIEALRD